MRPLRRALLALLALLLPLAARAQSAADAPRTGQELLARMRAAYLDKWYRTLTFVQKTTFRRPDGTERHETWYESLRYTPERGVELRIDRGDPARGDGTLYTADSAWSVRAGRLTSARAGGNEFLPLIEGVYVQPLARTVREVSRIGVDMRAVRGGRWAGRPVWIVGAADGDSTSPQLWVDAERNVLVRMVIAPGGRSLDVVLGGYERVAGGWLATRVTIGPVGAAPAQIEEYADWKADVPLSPALFDVARWTNAPHWARPDPAAGAPPAR